MTFAAYVFVELGEGRQGDYDPTDPDDTELLRLDYIEDGEEVESACTNLPASATETQRTQAISLVRAFAAAHPDVTPRKVIEIFSWLDETWLEPGNSRAEDLLIAMTPGFRGRRIGTVDSSGADDDDHRFNSAPLCGKCGGPCQMPDHVRARTERKSYTIIVSGPNEEVMWSAVQAAAERLANAVDDGVSPFDVDVIEGTFGNPLEGDNVQGYGYAEPRQIDRPEASDG